MTRLVTQATAIALLLFTVGLLSGCGGGSMHPGGLCIFSPQKLPAQSILLDDLPADARTLVGDETGEGKVMEIIKCVRESDGKYFHAITYADQAGELAAIQ